MAPKPAGKTVSEKDFAKLQSKVLDLERTIKALNTNYTNRNWSSNFNLIQPKDLGFSLVIGQSLQPFTTSAAIPYTKNTTTTVLTTTGGPSQGGALQGVFLTVTITDAATVGPSGNLILTVDNIVTIIPIFASQANQVLGTPMLNMMAKVTGTTSGLLLIPDGLFQSSLIVQIEFDNNGTSIAGNTITCEVMWSKATQ